MLVVFGDCVAKGFVRSIGFSQGILADSKLELPGIGQDVVHNLCGQLNVLLGQMRWYELRLPLWNVGLAYALIDRAYAMRRD